MAAIIELEKFLTFCDQKYRSLKPCNCGRACTNNHYCSHTTGDCYLCIRRVHDYHNNTVHYNCHKMLYCYVLKHGYRFSAEIFYLFQRIQRELAQKDELYVASIGCGPCTELFGALFHWRSIGKNNKTFHFRGFDLEPMWHPLIQVIPQFFSGVDVQVKNEDAFDYYKRSDERVDVLVLNYMLSDMLKFWSQGFPDFLLSFSKIKVILDVSKQFR